MNENSSYVPARVESFYIFQQLSVQIETNNIQLRIAGHFICKPQDWWLHAAKSHFSFFTWNISNFLFIFND